MAKVIPANTLWLHQESHKSHLEAGITSSNDNSVGIKDTSVKDIGND